MFTEQDNVYWRDFSLLINSNFEERKYWYSPKVIYSYKGFEITFDNYFFSKVSNHNRIISIVTRVYCKFIYPKRLKFRLEQASIINRLTNLFNGKLYKTSDLVFDRKYQVHSNNKDFIKLLNSHIRQSLLINTIDGFFIDNQEGIWGDYLAENVYGITLYLNSQRLVNSELLELKKTFESIVDQLINQFLIKPF
ncbi:hypothetical protein [Myroides sp.]|uniref:hypothetical protein n=1 Tax=Myroides sp. TaxID=1874736 RepID=UPI003F2C3D04